MKGLDGYLTESERVNGLKPKRQSIDKHVYYLNAFIRVLKESTENPGVNGIEPYLERMAFYGLKTVITSPEPTTKEEAVSDFELISIVRSFMSWLTLKQFINLFPIEKNYDGYKYEMKDYYSTLEAIEELGLQQNELIGDKLEDLLWDYMNDDIREFEVKSLTTISKIRRFEGHLHLFEEFMAANGHDTQNTFKNSKGQAFYVRNGKPEKIKMLNKSHLQVVK